MSSERLIVALDVPTVGEARTIVAALRGLPVTFKIGMWLFFEREVQGLIDELVEAGHGVFLDYKMYDIPETVRRGVAAVARRGVGMVTVHGDREIVAAAVEGAGGGGLEVFAVTVLTSQDDRSLRAMGYGQSVAELVALRVRLAAEAGADGVIASAADEPEALRAIAGRALLVVTPGIRLAGAGVGGDDQRRVATPEEAMARGADRIVVGRPITRAADPAVAARAVLESMASGLARRAGLG